MYFLQQKAEFINTHTKRKCYLFLGLLCLLITPYQSIANNLSNEAKLEQLKQDISTLQKKITNQTDQESSLDRQLRKSELAISSRGKKIRSLEHQLSQLAGRVNALKGKSYQLRLKLTQRSSFISKQLLQQYKLGKEPWLQLLLTQQDPEELSRMMRYFGIMNEKLVVQIKAFQIDLAELKVTEKELSDTKQKKVAQLNKIKLEQAGLKKNRKQRRNALLAIQRLIKSDKQRLDRLVRDRSRLENVLREIQKASLVLDSLKFQELKGKLSWPIKGHIRQSFGSLEEGIHYDGVWIASKTGREVKAVHHGRVVFSDWLQGYGLVMIIDHGSNYLTLYGYNEILQHEVGDWVTAGESIAIAGASGGRTDVGLYFGIRYQGKAINPKKWLVR